MSKKKPQMDGSKVAQWRVDAMLGVQGAGGIPALRESGIVGLGVDLDELEGLYREVADSRRIITNQRSVIAQLAGLLKLSGTIRDGLWHLDACSTPGRCSCPEFRDALIAVGALSPEGR